MFNLVSESEDAKKLRRYNKSLSACGSGAAILGVWDIIKNMMSYLTKNSSFWEEWLGDEGSFITARVVFIAAFALILAVELMVILWVGVSAYFDGKKGNVPPYYLGMAGILAGVAVFNLSFFVQSYASAESVLSAAALYFIDVLFAVTYVEIIVFSVKARKMRKKLGVTGEGTAKEAEA